MNIDKIVGYTVNTVMMSCLAISIIGLVCSIYITIEKPHMHPYHTVVKFYSR